VYYTQVDSQTTFHFDGTFNTNYPSLPIIPQHFTPFLIMAKPTTVLMGYARKPNSGKTDRTRIVYLCRGEPRSPLWNDGGNSDFIVPFLSHLFPDGQTTLHFDGTFHTNYPSLPIIHQHFTVTS
jgi:hypothetical protein